MAVKRICRDCGKEFLGGNAAKWCPECRKTKYYAAAHETENKEKKQRTCRGCGRKYTIPESGSEYCRKCVTRKIQPALGKMNSCIEEQKLTFRIRLSDEQYYSLMMAAKKIPAEGDNQVLFILDWAAAPIWGDTEETEDILEDRIVQLYNIWCAAHVTIYEICSRMHLTSEGMAKRYFLKEETVSKWYDGEHECPLALKLLLEKEAGLLVRE